MNWNKISNKKYININFCFQQWREKPAKTLTSSIEKEEWKNKQIKTSSQVRRQNK